MDKIELLKQIEKQCIQTKNALGFDNILKNQKIELINKIVDTAVIKYKYIFKIDDNNIDQEKYISYINTISEYLINNILNVDILTDKSILGLHQIIYSIFPKKERENSGKLRTEGRMTYNLNKDGSLENKDYFISENKVKKMFLNTIEEYNNEKSLDSIINFFQLNISKIHPFYDGNGRIFFILLDVLLMKHKYLPLFIFQDKKEYNLITERYYTDRNFKKLNINFLELILKKYKNYHIK